MLSKDEIKQWLLENCVNEMGNLDLSGLDFSDFDGNVFIDGMKVKNTLIQSDQEVGGCLQQSNQKVEGWFVQNFQEVGDDLCQDHQKVGGRLYQHSQEAKGQIYQYQGAGK